MNRKLRAVGILLSLCILTLGTGAGYRTAAELADMEAGLAYEVDDEEVLIDEALRAAEGAGGTSRKDTDKEECPADPDGSVLTKSGGINYYFDQKESYYNLNMDGVVSLAHSLGIEGDYWVRSDGCKMLGDYIMIAANLDVHPRGSLVPTSLGMGIVVDTGGFAYSNTTQVDIAVNW